jgi:hypothetical protein
MRNNRSLRRTLPLSNDDSGFGCACMSTGSRSFAGSYVEVLHCTWCLGNMAGRRVRHDCPAPSSSMYRVKN